jgi:hypothetical protein
VSPGKRSDVGARVSQAEFHPCPPDPACRFCNRTAAGDDFDWSFVRAAYCISLREREDRAAAAAAEFHRLGLCRHVLFYRPRRASGSVVAAIWDSHRTVLLHARRKGHEHALVLEDDVQFDRDLTPEKLRRIAQGVARLSPDWMLFFLGYWALWAYPVGRNLLRTGSACAHAYVGSRRLMDWFARQRTLKGQRRLLLAGRGVDAAYAALPGAYAWFPMIAIQSGSPGDHVVWPPPRPTSKLKHLVTHLRGRDWLLSRLMKPNHYVIYALSPVFWLWQQRRARRAALRA